MKVNNLINELERLKSNGYGENEVVIWAKDIFNNDHHTTIEDTKVVIACWNNKRNNKKEVVLLLP